MMAHHCIRKCLGWLHDQLFPLLRNIFSEVFAAFDQQGFVQSL
jgi:hypothetical protein